MWEGRPEWDEVFADSLIGATILVGLTRRLPTGDEQEQFYGVVLAVTPSDGVMLRLGGERAGQIHNLPPDLEAFEPAQPGEYRLRSTGEVVVDPDYVTSWTVDPPKQ